MERGTSIPLAWTMYLKAKKEAIWTEVLSFPPGQRNKSSSQTRGLNVYCADPSQQGASTSLLMRDLAFPKGRDSP